MKMSWEILDCTLRDGGYYTDWDFEQGLVESYLRSMASLPISMLELGYRAHPEHEYRGAYYYLPRYMLEWARSVIPDGPDFAVMLNAKSVEVDNVEALIADCQGLVKMVRMAVDPKNTEHALSLAERICGAGFEVGLNLMYLSSDYDRPQVFGKLAEHQSHLTTVALVDSFGGCQPAEVKKDIKLAKSMLECPVGFHGHDNLTLAYANSLFAIDGGADIIDSTVCGMGRGAGNLRTELIAAHHCKVRGNNIDVLQASGTISAFEDLRAQYKWGAGVPYIIAGLNNLPQAQVMDWLGQNRYSTAAIVKALTNQGAERQEKQFPPLSRQDAKLGDLSNRPCLVLGGGPTVGQHAEALIQFAKNRGALVIHASSRHLGLSRELKSKSLLCLVGDEYEKAGHELLDGPGAVVLGCIVDDDSYVGLPQQSSLDGRVWGVRSISAAEGEVDAVFGRGTPLGVALASSLALGASQIFLAGFDGYSANVRAGLGAETQRVLDAFVGANSAISLQSLTPTAYDLEVQSVYAYLAEGPTP